MIIQLGILEDTDQSGTQIQVQMMDDEYGKDLRLVLVDNDGIDMSIILNHEASEELLRLLIEYLTEVQ